MELAGGFPALHRNKIKHLNGDVIGLNSDTLLIIKLPDSKVLRVVSRSLFLTLVILALPSIGFIASGLPSSYSNVPNYGTGSFIARGLSSSYSNVPNYGTGSDSISLELLHLLFRDVASEGLLKTGDNALIVCSGIVDFVDSLQLLNDNEIDMVMESDLESQISIPDETFHFAFTSSSQATKFVDRVIKTGGIVALQLSNGAWNAFQGLPNYKIVYIRRFNSTIVAMRKIGPSEEWVSAPTRRRLFASASETKKEALKGLEGALLEPPRWALANLNKHLKKTKFLPDLLGDSLKGYHRRIFINLGLPDEDNGGVEWFHQNYPRRNQNFELYDLKVVSEESTGKVAAPSPTGISDWLRRNVREEEFVVMKAEAGMVEEMIKGKTICLVDELFLECKNQWRDGEKNKSRRAYWECLALYGRLRDEGVAVHQWWG